MGMTGGYVLWNNMESGYTVGDTLYYAAYSAEGTVTAVRTAAAPLSDCQPLVMDGRVIWYVTDQSAPTFYVLDESGVTSYPAGQSGRRAGRLPMWRTARGMPCMSTGRPRPAWCRAWAMAAMTRSGR